MRIGEIHDLKDLRACSPPSTPASPGPRRGLGHLTSSMSSARTKSAAASPPPFSGGPRCPVRDPVLEGFDFGALPELPAAQIRDFAAAAGESVILYGPVGVGKSHIAQAPRPPRRRPGRPHLGQEAPRAHPPRRPRPGRLRHARTHRTSGRRPLRAHHRTHRQVVDPDVQPAPVTRIRCSPARSSPSCCWTGSSTTVTSGS